RDVGERPSRWRRWDRQLDSRRHGRPCRRERRDGRTPRARAGDRSRHGRLSAPRCRLCRGGRRRAGARPRAAAGARRMSDAAGPRRLLIRDLDQLVSPAGCEAPLRGRALGETEVIADAYVLCADGRIVATGRMRDLGAVGGEIEELDGRGSCAIPGLVDCHTHACFGGDRVEEFALRAGGATYEELHSAGGGILSTVRATRAAGERVLEETVARHRQWMLASGTTTFESKSGYGLDRET